MTSSGFADGLGRRSLAFDREEGAMLERLILRPELGAFEPMLRERLDRLAAREDERIARPRTIERDLDGSLVVVSEFVPGSRLSDLLEASAESGAVPGVDAALGFLLDLLPALCGLHAGAGFAHGSISPSRTVLTPAGQIVLLDAIYGGALTHLRYSRHKLWTEFAVATPASSGPPRLDVGVDIAQSALSALMLVLGRPLRSGEYPDNPALVLREVNDAAEIRGTVELAAGLRTFMERALGMPGRTPYTAADDALFDVRVLAAELGADVCRRSLIDFINQMERPGQAPGADGEYDDLAQKIASYGLNEAAMLAADGDEPEHDLAMAVDAELNLDGLVGEDENSLTAETEVGIRDTTDRGAFADDVVDWVAAAAESERSEAERLLQAAVAASASDASRAGEHPHKQTDTPPTPREGSQPTLPALVEPAVDVSSAEGVNVAEHAVSPMRSRRAKRATRSARARKDKLRSAAEADVPALVKATAPPSLPPRPSSASPRTPAPPLEIAPAAPPKKSTPWLVAPDRAAAFEAAIDETQAAPAAIPATTAFTAVIPPPMIPPPVIPSGMPPVVPALALTPPAVATPPPAAPVPIYAAPSQLPVEPVFSRTVGAIAPSYNEPPAWTPVPAVPSSASPQLVPLKLKDATPKRAPRPDPVSDIYSSPVPVAAPHDEPAAFPWKLSAALVVIVLGAIAGGKVYLPAKGGTVDDVVRAPVSTPGPRPIDPLPAPAGGTSTGRLQIDTQPAGARILLDGKPAGESPVALDGIPAGRHTVTLVSSSGSVKRTVRIEPGRTVKLDIPIFSGWIGIYAPFVVEVAEAGKVIGTTEEPRLMLSPGRHELTLVNRELGYSSAHSVEIEPGEVKSISIDPRGTVNLNAIPWAEVWIDGRKAGDTPLANLQLPLGIREITFRHPELGERRISVTVKAGAPAAVSVDFSKPGL